MALIFLFQNANFVATVRDSSGSSWQFWGVEKMMERSLVVKTYLHIAVVILALVYLAPEAVRIGSVWNSKEYPTQNVTVEVSDNKSYTGSLSRDWNGDYLLKTDNGVIQFTSFKMMTVPRQDSENSISWRLFLPLLLLVGGVSMFPFVFNIIFGVKSKNPDERAGN